MRKDDFSVGFLTNLTEITFIYFPKTFIVMYICHKIILGPCVYIYAGWFLYSM